MVGIALFFFFTFDGLSILNNIFFNIQPINCPFISESSNQILDQRPSQQRFQISENVFIGVRTTFLTSTLPAEDIIEDI